MNSPKIMTISSNYIIYLMPSSHTFQKIPVNHHHLSYLLIYTHAQHSYSLHAIALLNYSIIYNHIFFLGSLSSSSEGFASALPVLLLSFLQPPLMSQHRPRALATALQQQCLKAAAEHLLLQNECNIYQRNNKKNQLNSEKKI